MNAHIQVLYFNQTAEQMKNFAPVETKLITGTLQRKMPLNVNGRNRY
jgi:hypothetical protein